MFSTLAGMIMATKVHFTQMNNSVKKRQDTVVAESLYFNKVEKLEEKEKYEKSKLPKSGYMTVEEYEAASRAKQKKDIEVSEGKIPKDKNMVYVPQKTFKLVKYNSPVGSPELNLPRRLNFDRQINAQGIISGDKKMLVYPAVYYYAQNDCTSCDLFLIKLNTSLSDDERVMHANIINKETKPLLSTSKDVETKFIFRTLTPIDFSSDSKKLVIKEKIGHRHDGIWQTNLWIYDFEKQEARELPQLRDAVVNYWKKVEDIDFDNNRWDIYPLGFDANNENRIIVVAYAYTGKKPLFLGTWSIDVYGENSKLENLDGASIPVSIIGYRLVEDSVKDIVETENEAKQAQKEEKENKKKLKAEEKNLKNIKKLEYKRKIQQKNMETLLKIQQRKEYLKQKKKNFGKQGLPTDYSVNL